MIFEGSDGPVKIRFRMMILNEPSDSLWWIMFVFQKKISHEKVCIGHIGIALFDGRVGTGCI